jgi:endonuclease/exonuclease/phosphatase family metal-dependent hydrolase
LVVKKKEFPSSDSTSVFNFKEDNDKTLYTKTNNYPSEMSLYIHDKLVSNPTFIKLLDRVMCNILEPFKTIIFNVHFPVEKNKDGTIIHLWERQKQIYDFMNEVVFIIRNITNDKTGIYKYKNFSIIFCGDFNANIVQRFPKELKSSDGKSIIPDFFKCDKVEGQKTIISTTPYNLPAAFGNNNLKYNLTNIDFSVLYPALVSVAAAPVTPKPAPVAPKPAPVAPAPITKYIFAFDIDDTLLASHTIDSLSMNVKDVRYRQEIIQNMRKVIESNNYVWIVTANSSLNYTRKNFCSKFFGSTDEDFFYKSEYFYFMNPDIIAQQYREAKNEFPSDKKLGVIDDLGWNAIHTRGLKPYGIYAQSLITKKKYNETHTPKIGDFKIYLFDDTNKDGYLAANSLKIGITFILVTDFTKKMPNLIPEFKKVLDDGTSKIGSVSAPVSMSPPASTPATTLKELKVMSFNTWYKPFSAQKIKDDGTPQEPDMQYCNIKKADGTLINACQENIMKEIMTQIEKGFQVIFLQEFTSRIQAVFDKCKFSAEYVANQKQIPFTMTYTPPGGKGPPLEYYVYSVNAQGETIITLCSRNFFPNPATQYYMGNLTGYPNNPLYASDGATTRFWEISGGARPYIVLVFDDIKMILINIHGPHGGTFNPYLQKVSKNPSGKGDFTTIGEKDSTGPYEYGGTKYKYNSDFGYPIPLAVQNEIDKKIKDVEKLNAEYDNLQDYTFRQLGDMLRKRIPQKLKDYKIIFAGDFNMRPDTTQRHLVKLSERLSSGKYSEGPFSNSSGVFDKSAQNNVTLTIGDTNNISTGTCCVERKSGSYGFGVYDQIYSNKLKVTKYWTYNGNIEYDKKGGILFSDHLPVYAEIELPAQGGGSYTNKHKTLKNNKSKSRKIKKLTSTSISTTRFTKKKHLKNSRNKKRKTRRNKR